MAINGEQLNAAIAEVYGAVGSVDGFRTVLGRIKGLLAGSSAVLFTPHADIGAGGFGFVEHSHPETVLQRRTLFSDKPVWEREAARKGLLFTGSTITDEALISQKALRNGPLFSDFLAPMNIGRLCGTVVVLDEDPVLPRTYLAVFRGVGSRPFAEEQRRALETLSPHVRQALRLTYRLESAEGVVGNAFDSLHVMRCGVVLVDRERRVLFMNNAAERLCVAEHGVLVRKDLHQGVSLHAARSSEDVALQQMLDSAISMPPTEARTETSSCPSVVVRGVGGSSSLIVTAVPVRRMTQQVACRHALAAVFLEEPAPEGAGSAMHLAEVYGLTAAECRVAEALVHGAHATMIGHQLGVSINTVRTHIKALYDKTGVRRMGPLVALLSRLAQTQVSTPPSAPVTGSRSRAPRAGTGSARRARPDSSRRSD